jgi:hypothetical protein
LPKYSKLYKERALTQVVAKFSLQTITQTMKTSSLFTGIWMGLLLLAHIPTIYAQDISADTVMAVGLSDKTFSKSLGEIADQHGVKGYYLITDVSHVAEGEHHHYHYMLSIYDTSLALQGTDRIVGGKKMALEETSYNGDMLLFRFYDPHTNEHSLFRYTLDAELVSESKFIGEPFNHWQAIHDLHATDDIQRVFPLAGKGFLFYQQKSISSSTVIFIPNNKAQKEWVYEHTEEKTNMLEFVFANPNLIISMLVRWHGDIQSHRPVFFLLGIDTNTGKKVFITPSEKDLSTLLPIDAYSDAESGNISLYGSYYYNAEATSVARQPNGLGKIVLNTKGEMIDSKFISWHHGPSELVPINTHGNRDDLNYLYVHRFLKMPNGKIMAVTEQYKKDEDQSASKEHHTSKHHEPKVATHNIVVFELSPEFELMEAGEIEKDKNEHVLPVVLTSLEGHQAFSYRLKRGFYFGYSFVRPQNDHEFIVGYKNHHKKSGKMLFYITAYNQDGITVKKNFAVSENIGSWKVLPGKQGHILFAYLDINMRLMMRIEKY